MTAVALPRWVIKTGSPEEDIILSTSLAFCLRSEIGMILGMVGIDCTSCGDHNCTDKAHIRQGSTGNYSPLFRSRINKSASTNASVLQMRCNRLSFRQKPTVDLPPPFDKNELPRRKQRGIFKNNDRPKGRVLNPSYAIKGSLYT
jgi:hypothetical protein